MKPEHRRHQPYFKLTLFNGGYPKYFPYLPQNSCLDDLSGAPGGFYIDLSGPRNLPQVVLQQAFVTIDQCVTELTGGDIAVPPDTTQLSSNATLTAAICCECKARGIIARIRRISSKKLVFEANAARRPRNSVEA